MPMTNFFRAAVEGATCDGRVLERQHITEMAEQYDPQVYGARVNLEHILGWSPTSDFRAYGDVVEAKAEEIAEGPLKGKLALLVKVDATDELVELKGKRQKIYHSIEVHPSFADTGKAYLVGVAVTDSPASLGTTRHFSVSGAEAVAATQSIQFSEYTEMSESAKKAQKVGLFAALLATFAAKPAESHAAAPPQEVVGQEAPPAEPETNEEQKESYAALLQKIEAGNEPGKIESGGIASHACTFPENFYSSRTIRLPHNGA